MTTPVKPLEHSISLLVDAALTEQKIFSSLIKHTELPTLNMTESKGTFIYMDNVKNSLVMPKGALDYYWSANFIFHRIFRLDTNAFTHDTHKYNVLQDPNYLNTLPLYLWGQKRLAGIQLPIPSFSKLGGPTDNVLFNDIKETDKLFLYGIEWLLYPALLPPIADIVEMDDLLNHQCHAESLSSHRLLRKAKNEEDKTKRGLAIVTAALTSSSNSLLTSPFSPQKHSQAFESAVHAIESNFDEEDPVYAFALMLFLVHLGKSIANHIDPHISWKQNLKNLLNTHSQNALKTLNPVELNASSHEII